ncbi:MAG: glycosyltransferase family 2 protein [Patescibacteria group bacterium]
MSDTIKKGVSIIIPSYNEEKNILKTLENIQRYVYVEKEVIVVDDSNDATEKIVREYAQNHPDIIFIKNKPKNRGFVQSLFLGVKSAKKDIVVFVMADQCDDPRTINLMYDKILAESDIVCGSRYMKGGKRIGGPKWLGYMSRYLCFFSYLVTRVPTHDVTNSFKMYKKQILKKMKYNFQAGTAVSMELLFQAYFKNAKIIEVATTWKGRPETRFKLSQRGPKYIKILQWSLENKLRQSMGLPLRKFYHGNK